MLQYAEAEDVDERVAGIGIVELDFAADSGDADAVAVVVDAGVFLARADEDARGFGGKSFEQRAGVFVGAMLAPHDGEDAELGVRRIAPEDFADFCEFLRGKLMLGHQFGGDDGFGHSHRRVLLLFARRVQQIRGKQSCHSADVGAAPLGFKKGTYATDGTHRISREPMVENR